MKIAVTAESSGTEARVDTRFGRSRYVTVVDLDKGTSVTLENPGLVAAGGAGVQTARFVAEQGTSILLTGNVGPTALSVLEASGVRVYTGAGGTVAEAVSSYQSGQLTETTQATVPAHSQSSGRRRRRS